MIAPNKNSRENKIIAGSYKYKRVQVDYTSAVSRSVCTYMYLVVHETAAINCRVSHILVSPSFALCFRSCIILMRVGDGNTPGLPRRQPHANIRIHESTPNPTDDIELSTPANNQRRTIVGNSKKTYEATAYNVQHIKKTYTRV